MFCPKCSQAISDDSVQFCSKCGFTIKNVREFLHSSGKIEPEETVSKRQKGIKQGLKLIVLSLILWPVLVFLIPMFPPDDKLVESSPSNTWFEQIGWAIIWTTFLIGAARIVWTMLFEQKASANEKNIEEVKQISQSKINQALPPGQDTPVSGFGSWKITDELYEPVLVRQKTSGELK